MGAQSNRLVHRISFSLPLVLLSLFLTVPRSGNAATTFSLLLGPMAAQPTDLDLTYSYGLGFAGGASLEFWLLGVTNNENGTLFFISSEINALYLGRSYGSITGGNYHISSAQASFLERFG